VFTDKKKLENSFTLREELEQTTHTVKELLKDFFEGAGSLLVYVGFAKDFFVTVFGSNLFTLRQKTWIV
jgi:hypothetical protein